MIEQVDYPCLCRHPQSDHDDRAILPCGKWGPKQSESGSVQYLMVECNEFCTGFTLDTQQLAEMVSVEAETNALLVGS